MKIKLQNVLLAVSFIAFFSTANAQSWTLVGTPDTLEHVTDITAKGNTLYAAVGKKGVMKSTDGGASYSATGTLPSAGLWGTPSPQRIIVGSNGDLLVAANDQHSMGVMGAVFYRSTDNGANWVQLPVNGSGGYDEAKALVEMADGTILMQVASNKLFSLAPGATTWSQIVIPNGGGISMINSNQDTIFIVTNLTALSYSADHGATWQRYGSNGTILGTTGSPQITKMLFTPSDKFIGFGGSGIFRAGINDTNWVSKSAGLPSPVYTHALATDGSKLWIAYEEQGTGNSCKTGVSSDNGDSWTPYPGNTPINSTLPVCLRRMVPMGADLYSFANKDVYKISNVATPPVTSTTEQTIEQLLVFPNPAREEVNFTFTGAAAGAVYQMVDMQGRLVMQNHFTPGYLNTIDLNDVPAGMYFIRITSGNSIVSAKFIRE